MILVVGSVVVKPEAMEKALELSREHVARSRKEPGCISHAVHHDTEYANRLVFVEEWADQAAFQEHAQVAASRTFAKTLMSLSAESPRLDVFECTKVSF